MRRAHAGENQSSMAMTSGPYVETQQVVTGFMYQLHVAEEGGGPGIVRLELGPYFFAGTAPQVKYPEAVTNEMCPPDWQAVRWVTDGSGASWLRWQGGRLTPEDGEMVFQMTSNYPPANTGAELLVWHGNRKSPDRFAVSAPDYSQEPPHINTRHDVIGKKEFAGKGCAPLVLLAVGVLGIAAKHWIKL